MSRRTFGEINGNLIATTFGSPKHSATTGFYKLLQIGLLNLKDNAELQIADQKLVRRNSTLAIYKTNG